MKVRPPHRENVRERTDRTLSFDSGGVDELGIIPWPILLRRRIARKVGIDHRWAVLWVVLSGLFTTGFTITLLVVSLDRIAGDLVAARVACEGPRLNRQPTVEAAGPHQNTQCSRYGSMSASSGIGIGVPTVPPLTGARFS